ncbi:MAG: hypothetical protein KF791_04905 [Verrucomicrobiae bacterium]|nr:hypothetical protein [Verrucomicrobiae bacterium]
MSDSRAGFFRQSAWLGVATVLGGVFLTAVHPVFGRGRAAEYEVFGTMLRLFLLLGIPSAGLQVTFAQQSAIAITPEARARLATTTRAVLGGIVIFWAALLLAAVIGRDALTALWRLGDSRVLWPTLGVGLMGLLLPVLRGLLQGRQDFATLGWLAILDGLLRLLLILAALHLLHCGAAGALVAVLLGMLLTTALGAWRTRDVWCHPGAPVDWRRWLGNALPFTAGAGALLILANVDVPYLQATIPGPLASHFRMGEGYIPAAMIGFALVQFTGQLAVVMFPKIARSVAGRLPTDALTLAFLGTLLLGTLAVAFVSVFPQLPLRIVYFTNPAALAAAPVVPWHTSAMVAFALANVLVANQLARGRFWIVGWLIAIVAAYLGTLTGIRSHLLTLEPVAAYRLLTQVLGAYSLLLLLIAAALTWRPAAR